MSQILEFKRKITREELFEKISSFELMEEAYDWAESRINTIYIKLTPVAFSIDNIISLYERHISVFYRKDKLAIFRSYDVFTRSDHYNYIKNTNQLMEEHPDLIRYLIRNGEYAYIVAMKPEYAKLLKY